MIKKIVNQQYEQYWNLTVEYTDINKPFFVNTLKLIIFFLDENPSLKIEYSKELYNKLQNNIYSVYKKNDKASIRKSINQMIKLGFVNFQLKGYHKLCKKFLSANNSIERELIFSEIFYSSSNISGSVTKEGQGTKHIEFLLKTLLYKENKSINKEELTAIMSQDISLYSHGYLRDDELKTSLELMKLNGFESRKYNQRNYLFKFIQYLPGITTNNKTKEIKYLEDDSIQVVDVDVKRDPVLFRIMKEKIKKESKEKYGDVVCYLTKKPQKSLVCSHIISLSDCLRKGDVDSAYNYKNALLLEPNVDAYFDKHDLTFNSKGDLIFQTSIKEQIINDYKDYSLDDVIFNSRKFFLEEHRKISLNKKGIT